MVRIPLQFVDSNIHCETSSTSAVNCTCNQLVKDYGLYLNKNDEYNVYDPNTGKKIKIHDICVIIEAIIGSGILTFPSQHKRGLLSCIKSVVTKNIQRRKAEAREVEGGEKIVTVSKSQRDKARKIREATKARKIREATKATRARKVAEAKFDSKMQLTFQAILNGPSSVPMGCPPTVVEKPRPPLSDAALVTVPLEVLTGDELFELRSCLGAAVRRSGLVGELLDDNVTAAMARVNREWEKRLDASNRALDLLLRPTTLKESSATAQEDGGGDFFGFKVRGWGNSLFVDPKYLLVGEKRQRIS